MNHYRIIEKPLMTEKCTDCRDAHNVYIFKVHKKATKHQVKESIEKLFSVKVLDVRTINVLGKPRRRGRSVGRTPSFKKAYVRLSEGQTIPIFEGL